MMTVMYEFLFRFFITTTIAITIYPIVILKPLTNVEIMVSSIVIGVVISVLWSIATYKTTN
jgi:hypothetical protein